MRLHDYMTRFLSSSIVSYMTYLHGKAFLCFNQLQSACVNSMMETAFEPSTV